MKRWMLWLPALALLCVFSARASAQTADEEVEKILKKYDEKLRQLREEMRKEIEQLLGKKASPEALPGVTADLGIGVEAPKESVRALLNLGKEEGLVVIRVAADGAGAKAGLKKFDILVAVDGKTVGSAEGLRKALEGRRSGDKVELTLVRETERVKVVAVLGGGGGEAGSPDKPPVSEFLDETFRGKGALIRKNLRDLLQGDTEARMRARRFFEEFLNRSEKDRERVLAELERAAEEFLDKVDPADRETLRKAFRDVIRGFRKIVENPVPAPSPTGKRSQKKEDIEKFLDDLLEGKASPGKKPETGDKDDIDKLLDELLGKKTPAEKPKDGKEAEGELPVKIPPEWDQALANILGKEGWDRLKKMMTSPEYKEMLKQFFPEGFEFTPKNVRKLLEQYGVDLETLPDRLREMGIEDEAIEKIMKLLKEEGAPPDKRAKGWIGFKAKDDEEGAGVVLTKIEPNSPAAEAGLLVGDVLVDVEGTAVKTMENLKEALKDRYSGDVLSVAFKRDGKALKGKVKLSEKK